MKQEKLTQLHLGLGSFHRAHQALYMQLLHDQGDNTWELAGGNIRPDMTEMVEALKEQNGEYVLETVSPQGEREYKQICSIKRIISWDSELQGLVDIAIEPNTRILSFTVTEAGYYLDHADRLDLSYSALKTDVEGTTCQTIYGALTRLLCARMDAGAGPITLLNCDNLRANGDRFSAGFKQFLTLTGNAALLAWVEQHTSAPNCMVDRITPRPTPVIAERVKQATGIEDKVALMGETFIQWVIEDHFVAGRPAWEKVGAELVTDVMPYEEAKIRILNATHSCIAWAGTFVGFSYIHEGALDAEIRQFAFDYVTNDVIPVLTPSPLDLENYRDVVLDRFSNANILDTNARVAMDGFSKIPGFVLPTLRQCIEQGRSIDSVSILPALFLEFLLKVDRDEIPYKYEDQLMDVESLDAIVSAEDPVAIYCSERLLFNDIAGNSALVAGIRRAFVRVQGFVERRG